MRESQFAILMSGLFLVGHEIHNSTGLLIIAALWLVMALVYSFWPPKSER